MTPCDASSEQFFVQAAVSQTLANAGTSQHAAMGPVHPSAPSTAGLMEAVLTSSSTGGGDFSEGSLSEGGLDTDDRSVTPTPGNLTTGMDVDNNAPVVIRFRSEVFRL